MRQFIEECLTPNYKIHWLDSIYFDPVLLNNIQTENKPEIIIPMYVAISDSRLLRI